MNLFLKLIQEAVHKTFLQQVSHYSGDDSFDMLFVFSKLERVEWEREGIQWDFIAFPENQHLLENVT